MKKNSSVFGVLSAVVVAAIFLAVSFPTGKDSNAVQKAHVEYYQYY
jgi:hypothetical protein